MIHCFVLLVLMRMATANECVVNGEISNCHSTLFENDRNSFEQLKTSHRCGVENDKVRLTNNPI
jgi:hypothetical protein